MRASTIAIGQLVSLIIAAILLGDSWQQVVGIGCGLWCLMPPVRSSQHGH